jgi:hypothetical protein
MDKLFPIVRRVRRPLLPTAAESPRSAAFTPEPTKVETAENKVDQSLVTSTSTEKEESDAEGDGN